jgi:hypothetical protein
MQRNASGGSFSRIDAAVPPARTPAPVFALPRLLDARCASVEEVLLVDTLRALPVAGAAAPVGDAA